MFYLNSYTQFLIVQTSFYLFNAKVPQRSLHLYLQTETKLQVRPPRTHVFPRVTETYRVPWEEPDVECGVWADP